MAKDIFISYSRKDYEQVAAFKRDIEAATLASCWMDLEGIESGNQIFTKAIIKAINACPIFLFMLSEDSQQSENALKELDFAYKKHREEGKKVVIVYIKPCQMTDEFSFDYSKADTIDWHNPLQKGKLIRDLKKWIGKEESGIPTHDEPTDEKANVAVAPTRGLNLKETFHKNRKGCTITLSVCLLLCLVFIPFYFQRVDSPNSPPPISDADTICTPVDLGLPSGTLWADRNLGAKRTSDFGHLYAWGEVSTKRDYSQGAYLSKDKPMGKITTSKNDAATAILGEEWCMPSEAQVQELLDQCEWTWTQWGGHNGFEIKGKNGNKIFLPAAGWKCSTNVEHQNIRGYYWTSERNTSNPPFARSLQFPKPGMAIIGNGYLYYGRSIRAVYQGVEAVSE